MKISQAQYSFHGGEISPQAQGRADVQGQLNNSLANCTNMVVTQTGALVRRPGTKNIGWYSGQLVPFFIDSDTSFLMEFRLANTRVIQDREFLYNNSVNHITNGTMTVNLANWTSSVTGSSTIAASANGAQFTKAALGDTLQLSQQVTHGLGSGAHKFRLDLGLTGAQRKYMVAFIGTSAGDASLGTVGPNGPRTFNVDSSSFYITLVYPSWAPVGTFSVSCSLYANLLLNNTVNVNTQVNYTTTGKRLFVTNNTSMAYVEYVSGTTFTFNTFPTIDGPYYDLSHRQYGGRGSGISIQASATTGSVTLTATSALFVSTDVGRVIRYRASTSATWGWATITAFTNSTNVTATVNSALSAATTDSKEWQLGAWSTTTGYPRVTLASQGRLLFARTTDQPNGFWASRTGNVFNFAPDDDLNGVVSAATAISTNIENAPRIEWLMGSGQRLFVGTQGDEQVGSLFAINSLGGGIGTITIDTVDSIKVANARPLNAEGSVIFADITGTQIWQTSYNYDYLQTGYRTVELSSNARHMIGGMTYMCYQRVPHGIIWIADVQNAQLVGITYSKNKQMQAFHKHVFGGDVTEVEQVVTSYSGLYNYEDVYITVDRSNGIGTIELLGEYADPVEGIYGDYDGGGFFIDSSYEWQNTYSLNVVYNINDLADEEVYVIADHKYILGNPFTVANEPAIITLAEDCNFVQVGYPSVATIETLQFEGGNQRGSALGRKRNIDRVTINFWQTAGATITFTTESGMTGNQTIDPVLLNFNQVYGDGPSLKTGYVTTAVNGGNIRNGGVIISSVGPLPMHITNLTTEIDVSDW